MALTKITSDGITDGTITATDLATNIDLVDNQKLRLGTGNDLEIYHNGSNSYIKDAGTGSLLVLSNQFALQNAAGSETLFVANENGSVDLYYDDSKKFETTSIGNQVTGQLVVPDGGNNSGNNNVTFGSDNDCHVYHNGTDFYIVNTTGNLDLRAKAGEKSILAAPDGAVELYHDNIKTFETTGDGAKLTSGSHFDFHDNSRIRLGDGADLQIYHSGSHSYINNGTGNLNIRTGGTLWIDNAAGTKTYIKAIENEAVKLYYNNVDVFKTNSSGIQLKSGGSSQISFYDVSTATIIIYTHSTGLRWWDDVNDDPIMELSQSGNLNIDGSYSNSGVDYAEYFESTDGSAIAIGTTVVLEDGKVRAATSSETPIGVIRPKTSGTSVTGGVNQLNWQGKYLVDDYDGQIMESAVHCTWTDDNEVNQQCWKDRPPTGVTIPSDAVETTRERPKLNPLFDESKTYVPRSERDEWNCVGLLGQIPITKGQPTSSSWIKMKDKTSTVELWMVK